MKVVINKKCNVMQFVVVYRPCHPGMDWIFTFEFDSFTELFSSRNGKLLICGDFNYWVDSAHKLYSSEFMELLNTNNSENLFFSGSN